MTFYTHWRDVPAAAWRWPNFSPAEIACRGTGKLLLNPAALDKLQALRAALAKPLIIRSAYRSPEHNRAVGGARASKHMGGVAFDVAMANHDPEAFEAAAWAVGFQGFGFYPSFRVYPHRPRVGAELGRALPEAGDSLCPETPAAREVLAESRDAEGRRRGRLRHRRRRRRRGGAAGAGEDAGRDPAIGALPRHVCGGCSSRSRSSASPSRSTRGSKTGSGAGGDRRASRYPRRQPPAAERAAPRALGRHDLLLLLACRRSGERLGRLLEQRETLERSHDVQRQMLEAAARRPRDRGELAERLRDGRF